MYFSFFATLLIATGANADTIVDLAVGSADHKILVEALTKAKLVDTLSGTGPFTVFAPTDKAFGDALTALGLSKEQLLDKADLADILKYHVLPVKVMSTDLQATQSPATVQGATVTITKGDKVKFADAEVTAADLTASNGVVHVIDKVVLPPTIVDLAVGSADHKILVEALTKAKLVDTLKGTGPFTVFAPTDKAFGDALTALGLTKQQLLDKADLADILKYHVLPVKAMSTDLKATQSPATVQGATVTITKGDKVKFADAEVTAADLTASNGVVHVIDKVVLPPTIVDLAVGSADHKILVEALTKAKLVDTLKGTGPFTVFAPTDKAFGDALTALGLTKQQLLDKADLADILKYHVLPVKVMSTDLKATQSPATVQGATVTVTKSESTVKFADATVNPADLVASNGVVHVIDKVVLPPAGTPAPTPAPSGDASGASIVSSALACAIAMGTAIFLI